MLYCLVLALLTRWCVHLQCEAHRLSFCYLTFVLACVLTYLSFIPITGKLGSMLQLGILADYGRGSRSILESLN